MIENKLTVGQIARRFGVSARTIRHYEKIGLLETQRDTVSKYRLYGEAESKRVDQIMILKSMGFTLKEISSIITSNGDKETIIHIIKNRLKALVKQSLIYNQCIDLLNEFLAACSLQEDENIDSFGLLNELLSDKSKSEAAAALEEASFPGKSDYLKEDGDLEVLKACLAEDFNPLFLPFILGSDDGDLLESFTFTHRRFWDFKQVLLTDGTNLDDLFNPATFGNTVIEKIWETVCGSLPERDGDHFSYKDIVADLCNTMMGVDYKMEEALPVLERKLVYAVFARAVDILEMGGRFDEKGINAVAGTIGIELQSAGKQQIMESIDNIIQSGGIPAFHLARLVDSAIMRNRYAVPFYVLTESSAFTSSNWELDRALDMAVGFLWTHEIAPAGKPYSILMPVIFHIAYMRTRMLYASTSYKQPDIVWMDEFMVIGLELITTDRDGESFRKCPQFEVEEYIKKRAGERIPNRLRPGVRYSLVTRYKGEYHSYIVGEKVSSLENIPEGMTGEPVPSGTYAVFTVDRGIIPYKIGELIHYIFQQWLPNSPAYQWETRPVIYISDNAADRPDSGISICVPVKEKEAETCLKQQ